MGYEDLIAGQRGTAEVLARLIDSVGGEVLGRVWAPGKWSVRLGHDERHILQIRRLLVT
jgi:hypothetical protein